jgi:hypothetical protein
MQNFCLEAAFRILLKTMNGNLGELKYFRTAKKILHSLAKAIKGTNNYSLANIK